MFIVAKPGTYVFNISMGWLGEESNFLGIPFQNWMPIAVAIVLIGIAVTWWREWRG